MINQFLFQCQFAVFLHNRIKTFFTVERPERIPPFRRRRRIFHALLQTLLLRNRHERQWQTRQQFLRLLGVDRKDRNALLHRSLIGQIFNAHKIAAGEISGAFLIRIRAAITGRAIDTLAIP